MLVLRNGSVGMLARLTISCTSVPKRTQAHIRPAPSQNHMDELKADMSGSYWLIWRRHGRRGARHGRKPGNTREQSPEYSPGRLANRRVPVVHRCSNACEAAGCFLKTRGREWLHHVDTRILRYWDNTCLTRSRTAGGQTSLGAKPLASAARRRRSQFPPCWMLVHVGGPRRCGALPGFGFVLGERSAGRTAVSMSPPRRLSAHRS